MKKALSACTMAAMLSIPVFDQLDTLWTKTFGGFANDTQVMITFRFAAECRKSPCVRRFRDQNLLQVFGLRIKHFNCKLLYHRNPLR